MYKYVALIAHGPRWLEGKSVYEQGKPVAEHLVAIRAQYDAGVLQLGGPFAHGGGIAVLNARDEGQAREVMDADPAVLAGVMVYELRRLHAVFDALSGLRSDGPVSALEDSAQVGSGAGR